MAITRRNFHVEGHNFIYDFYNMGFISTRNKMCIRPAVSKKMGCKVWGKKAIFNKLNVKLPMNDNMH